MVEEETEIHPLQGWMNEDEFALVKSHVEFDPATNLANLSTETRVEIYLNTEISFQNPNRDVRRREWFPEQSCKYWFHFRGVTSGVSIKFVSIPNDPTSTDWKKMRDTLLYCLAKQCKSIKRLSIHGYAIKSDENCGFMGSYETFDGPNGGVFSSWAETGTVLSAFARAGHWQDTLQDLDVMNHANSISPTTLRSLPTLPQNLRGIQVAHLPWETDERVSGCLEFFPTLERLQVTCSNQFGMHYPFYGFRLWSFLDSLHLSNPNIRSLAVVWNAVASVSVGVTDEEMSCCLDGLRSLSRLERLTIGPNVWDGTQDSKELAHGILRLLPETSIKELRLQTIPVLKDYLYEQLLRVDCKLDLLDVTPYGVSRRRDIPLAILSKFAKSIYIPAHGDSTALDFVFLLRRFRKILSLDVNQAAPVWPLLLATVGQWQVGKGVSMPWNRRGEPTHWLTDNGIKPPPPPSNVDDNDKAHHGLRRSMFYALLRERADVVCAGLQSQIKPTTTTTRHKSKRAAEELGCNKKCNKKVA